MKEPSEATERRERRWLRALPLVALALWVKGLVAIPFVLLAILLPRKSSKVLAVAALAVVITFSFDPPSGGLWYLQRGWALVLGGWFVALTLRWPGASFTTRGLGSVFGAAATAALILVRNPNALASIDSLMRVQINTAARTFDAAAQAASDPEVATRITTWVEAMTEASQQLYPSVLLVASICALGAAWWGYVRLAQGSDRGLGPLREFRFNDQLVWIAVVGVGLLLWGAPEVGSRVGANAVVFMSALYAVRGAAVVVFVMGGVSLTGGILVTLAMLLVAPYVFSLAVFIGLGDTWLHVRERAASALGGGAP